MLLPSIRPLGSASWRLPSEYEVPSSKQCLAWRQVACRSQASSRLDLNVLILNVVLGPVVTVMIVIAVIADNLDVRVALGSDDDGVILLLHSRSGEDLRNCGGLTRVHLVVLAPRKWIAPCGVASTRGQSPRTLAAAVGLASSALAMGGRHRACGGDSNNRCGSLFCGTPARKTSPKTNCQKTHAPRTRPAVPLEPKVRSGRRLVRRDEAVVQFEDPVHV